MPDLKRKQKKNQNKLQLDDPFEVIQYVASYNIRNLSLAKVLTRWWCDKYKRSPKSSEFLSYTLGELLLERYEDLFNENPKDMYSFMRKIGEEISFEDLTDDPQIMKWEAEQASCKEINLYEGMTPEQIKAEEEMMQKLAIKGTRVPSSVLYKDHPGIPKNTSSTVKGPTPAEIRSLLDDMEQAVKGI